MYAGRMRPGVVAALVDHLPAACAVGRELGGAAAMSDEWHAIRQLDLTVRQAVRAVAGGKGDEPKAWELPEGVRDREARVAREAEAKRRWQERAADRERRARSGEAMTLRDL